MIFPSAPFLSLRDILPPKGQEESVAPQFSVPPVGGHGAKRRAVKRKVASQKPVRGPPEAKSC